MNMYLHSFILQNQTYKECVPKRVRNQKVFGISDKKAYNKVIIGKKKTSKRWRKKKAKKNLRKTINYCFEIPIYQLTTSL